MYYYLLIFIGEYYGINLINYSKFKDVLLRSELHFDIEINSFSLFFSLS